MISDEKFNRQRANNSELKVQKIIIVSFWNNSKVQGYKAKFIKCKQKKLFCSGTFCNFKKSRTRPFLYSNKELSEIRNIFLGLHWNLSQSRKIYAKYIFLKLNHPLRVNIIFINTYYGHFQLLIEFRWVLVF